MKNIKIGDTIYNNVEYISCAHAEEEGVQCKFIDEDEVKQEQEKSVTITTNGIVEVLPDGEKTLSKVTITADIPQTGEDMLQARIDSNNSCNYLFYYYTGTNVDFIGNLDTSNVTGMDYMFSNCTNLTSIPQLNTSNVTGMANMFYQCSNLTTIPQLDTSKVTYMNSMFYQCFELTSIPQLNTSNVTNMTNMFSSCSKLTSVPQLNTSKVTRMNQMFYACNKLITADISKFNLSSTTYSARMFYNCHSLKQVIIRDFGDYTLDSSAFTNCFHLTGTVNETYNPNGDKDCYIYVPSSMVNTLKSATNWATYADQIRALEDYTVDGTTTGELDESKI